MLESLGPERPVPAAGVSVPRACWGAPPSRTQGTQGSNLRDQEGRRALGSCRPGHMAIRTRHAAQPVPRHPRTQRTQTHSPGKSQPPRSRSRGFRQLANEAEGGNKSLSGEMTELLLPAHLKEVWNEILTHSRALGRGPFLPGAQVGGGSPLFPLLSLRLRGPR